MRDKTDPKAFATKSSITLSQVQTSSDQVSANNKYVPEKFGQGSKKGTGNKDGNQRPRKSNASSNSRGKASTQRSASADSSDNTLVLQQFI